MNEQDKQLLLKDLCARLPYGVKLAFRGNININIYTCKGFDSVITEDGVREEYCITGRGFVPIESIKPYLRPMSSMTKEEATTIATLWGFEDFTSVDVTDDCVLVFFEVETGFEHAAIMFSEIVASVECYDYLNSIHADYRGLIEKGLALPAPEGMYKTQTK